MNATLTLHAPGPTTGAVTPVADAVLAPGAGDAAHPLFSLMLGQAPAEDAETPDTAEAADAAIAPWLMALDSQQAPALPFTQPFSRWLGAAAREAAPDGARPEGEGVDATLPPVPSELGAGARAASVNAVPAPQSPMPAAATPASPVAAEAAQPASPGAPQRPVADATRTLPADAASVASTVRAARAEAVPPADGFATVFNANPGSSSAAASDPVVRLDAQRSELWQRPLAQALGDRVQWQSTQGIDQARIRLDPPALGRIEIVVRQEGAQLQVQLTASSPEVARQLQHMGDGLRQELGQRQGQSVQVQVQAHDSAGAQADARGQRQGQQGRDEADPGQALRDEHDAARRFTLA